MSFKIVPPGTPMPSAQPNVPAQAPSNAQDASAHLKQGVQGDSSKATPPVVQEGTSAAAPEQELDPRFADLGRKEQVVRKAAATLQAERTKLAEERKALESSHIAKDRLAKDPLAVLAEHGISSQTLLEHLINAGVQPKAPQESVPNAEIEALKAEIKAMKDGQKTGTETAYQAALKQIEAEATKQADNFPTIKARGAVSDVVELIEKHFKATNMVMPTSEAMAAVEAELIEEGLKWASLDTVKAKLAPKADESKEAILEKPVYKDTTRMPAKIVPSGTARNLNNSLTSTRPLTARERAIRAAQGNK